MRSLQRPQKDVFSPSSQNEIVYQPSHSSVIPRRLLLMLPFALAILSCAVVAIARYDGSITLLHYNDLDGKSLS